MRTTIYLAKLSIMTLVFATMIGCSKPKTAEAIKADFKTNLYGSSKQWSSIEWDRCDEFMYNVNAVYSLDGDNILFGCVTLGDAKQKLIEVTAKLPTKLNPSGEIAGRWYLRNGTDFAVSRDLGHVPKSPLSRAAEDMATFLHKSFP